jgi:hypothetical protein
MVIAQAAEIFRLLTVYVKVCVTTVRLLVHCVSVYFLSECYIILSPTQLIISLLLILADRQHVSALFK